jgi:hypothetical protein
MVYLGGPRGRRSIRLHDPPLGYRRPRMPAKERQREERQDRILLRVATLILIPTAAAFVVLLIVLIAMHI